MNIVSKPQPNFQQKINNLPSKRKDLLVYLKNKVNQVLVHK